MSKQIKTLYEHFKNTPKRLKVVCDWDEVIQAAWPYALWVATNKKDFENWTDTSAWNEVKSFPEYFYSYWFTDTPFIEYSPYGSKNKVHKNLLDNADYSERIEEQARFKNSPFFYQQTPFLTITKDLLKLIKEGKVENLIFLSAYDKRKFPSGDPRKKDIFKETFDSFHKITANNARNILGWEKNFLTYCEIKLELIPFDNENQGQTKADWIKQNAKDFDVFIDDNPIICKQIIENNNKPLFNSYPNYVVNSHMTVCSPYYPAIRHDERVLLVKQEVSDLKIEDFKKSGN